MPKRPQKTSPSFNRTGCVPMRHLGTTPPLISGIMPLSIQPINILDVSLSEQQEFFFANKYLARVEEKNEEVSHLGINEDTGLSLVMAYRDWIPSFNSDNSTMSVILMHEFLLHIEQNSPEDFEVLRSYYMEPNPNRIKTLSPSVKEIWKKYRSFEYFYKFSKAFRSAADTFSSLVDEGETPLERTKLFYLWLVIFHGQENLFIDLEDRRLAAEHDKKNLSMESIIGLLMMKKQKSMVHGFEALLSLQDNDIIVSQMKSLLEYAAPQVSNKIKEIIAIKSNTLSLARVADIRECKRRLFASKPNTRISPYTFCTKTGIANIEAEKFIANAKKIMRKHTPGDWVEHMICSTYRYLEEHPDFRFGKGVVKKTLPEWLLHLGYVKTTESVSTDNPVKPEKTKASTVHPITESSTAPVSYKNLTPEENWALECIHNIENITFPMSTGAFKAMKEALETAEKFFGDDTALKTVLKNQYVWIELFRKISSNQNTLKRQWRSQPEFKKILKLIQNYSDLL